MKFKDLKDDSIYGSSKICLETIARSLHSKYSVIITILRLNRFMDLEI